MEKKTDLLPPVREIPDIVKRIKHQAKRAKRNLTDMLRIWYTERLEVEEEIERKEKRRKN